MLCKRLYFSLDGKKKRGKYDPHFTNGAETLRRKKWGRGGREGFFWRVYMCDSVWCEGKSYLFGEEG